MERRGFLKSILAAGAAPAVVGSGILMPVKEIILPRGNYLIPPSLVVKEALAMPNKELIFSTSVSRTIYAEEVNEQVKIRRPSEFIIS